MNIDHYQIPANLVNRALWAFIIVAMGSVGSIVTWWNEDSARWAEMHVQQSATDRELARLATKLDKVDEEVRRHETQDNSIHFEGARK